MSVTRPAELFVFGIGADLELKAEGSPIVKVTAIEISGSIPPRVSYRVAWWQGGQRYDAWITECEIKGNAQHQPFARCTIGFV